MAVYIEERLCKGCGLCVYFCKHDVLKMSDRRNAKGYNVVEIFAPERCTACKLCEINCPDFAVYVEAEKVRGASKKRGRMR
jgi:2-oxoglutarate ferredoxin oxidoreductase subunit delta